jgi:signal transduction histidine kinase
MDRHPVRRQGVGRLIRSLQVQLFLWAIMPVVFVIIAISFTGVYAHQRTMRDFVVDRDLDMAHLAARIAQDGIAQGLVGSDGSGLAAWMDLAHSSVEGTVLVLSDTGRVLADSSSTQIGENLYDAPGIRQALERREGSLIVDTAHGRLLLSFTAILGTDWIVLIQEPIEQLIGPILRFPSLVPVVAGGAGILSLMILTFGWLTIVRPLQQLVRAAEQVSWGNFEPLESTPLGGAPQAVQEVHDLHQAILGMVERIRGYEAGMRDYLGAVTRGQEAERARLARELHDGAVQELIALGQRAEMAQRLVERGQAGQAQALLGELRHTARETVQELRRLIGALRPVYLEDLGFLPALGMLIQQSAALTSAEIRLEKDPRVERLAPEVELATYRIAQEALSNAIQHARAEHIDVRVTCKAETLVLSVRDDGVGFRLPPQPDAFTRTGHFGLIGMRERATSLGGTLQIDTAPGRGTQITARLSGRSCDEPST